MAMGSAFLAFVAIRASAVLRAFGRARGRGGLMVAEDDPANGSDGYDVAEVRPQQVGWFRFYFDDERWEWSDEVQIMHGYEPGTVTPTTELVLSHKHPDDYQQVASTLDHVRRYHQAFSTRHRIIDT